VTDSAADRDEPVSAADRDEPVSAAGATSGAVRQSGAAEPEGDTPPAPDRWTILGMIRWATEYLEGKGVTEARLDAEHLLAESLGVERLQLYLQFERPLTPEELAAFKPLLLRRAAREPLQYILGRTPFREIELKTDGRALIPRPETEVLVQEVLDRTAGRDGLSALDLGTGTGAIALSLAVEGGFDRVVATDVSAEALDLARDNAGLLGLIASETDDAEPVERPEPREVEIESREGDLFGAPRPTERQTPGLRAPLSISSTSRSTASIPDSQPGV